MTLPAVEPKGAHRISVTPIMGRALCYFVSSSKGGEPYLVDLTRRDGTGDCTCGDFSCRCVANIKAGAEPMTDATQCKHLRAARLHFMQDILESLLAQ